MKSDEAQIIEYIKSAAWRLDNDAAGARGFNTDLNDERLKKMQAILHDAATEILELIPVPKSEPCA